MSLPLSLTFILLYLGTLLLVAEGLNRFSNAKGEITRKIVHIGSGNVVLLAWWWHIPLEIALGAALVAAILALSSYWLPILPSLNSVGRKSWGTFFYAVSFGLLFAWFWEKSPQFTALGILIMAWGDGLAAVVGQNFGHHPYEIWGAKKSLEGSLTMLLVSVALTGILLSLTQSPSYLTGVVALGVGLLATGLESFSWLGIDNLFVPLGSAALAFALSRFL